MLREETLSLVGPEINPTLDTKHVWLLKRAMENSITTKMFFKQGVSIHYKLMEAIWSQETWYKSEQWP